MHKTVLLMAGMMLIAAFSARAQQTSGTVVADSYSSENDSEVDCRGNHRRQEELMNYGGLQMRVRGRKRYSTGSVSDLNHDQ